MSTYVEYAAAGFVFKIGSTVIGGLDKFAVGTDVKEADTTTFDDRGCDSHVVTRRGKSLKLTGKRKVDPRDAGQAAVEALAELVGYAAEGTFEVLDSQGDTLTKFVGTVKMDDIGGGLDDSASWGCEIKRTGPELS
ncbi:hypothetical protein LLG39_17930 [bacterium]|nr:hypothetical protein [bacterium]